MEPEAYCSGCGRAPQVCNCGQLDAADWEEIYYALEYKLTSPAVQGSDREAREWRAHLNRILRTIGPDGQNMTEASYVR